MTGTGSNAFNNLEHSTFTTLDYVRLNGGLLTNLGLVTPGGPNAVQTTALRNARSDDGDSNAVKAFEPVPVKSAL